MNKTKIFLVLALILPGFIANAAIKDSKKAYDIILLAKNFNSGTVAYVNNYEEEKDRLLELAQDPNEIEVIRVGAIWGLRNYSNDEKIYRALKELAQDSNEILPVRKQAIHVLGDFFNKPELTKFIMNIAQDINEPIEVRTQAIYSLRFRLHTGNDRKFMISLADYNSEKTIKTYAIRVLGRYAGKPEVKDFLKDTYRNADKDIKIEALRAMAWSSANPDIKDFLLDNLRNVSEIEIKVAFIRSLFYITHHPEVTPKLQDLTTDDQAAIREAAIRTLSRETRYFAEWICPEHAAECERMLDPGYPYKP
ncbi:HEAT repeat domain-containing protein [Elusimicrobiota bacterium]